MEPALSRHGSGDVDEATGAPLAIGLGGLIFGAVSLIVTLVGVSNLFQGAWISGLIGTLVGLLFLASTAGMYRGVHAAWLVCVIATGVFVLLQLVGAVASVTDRIDEPPPSALLGTAALFLVLLGLLLAPGNRAWFRARSGRDQNR